ncbi:hypothetical protein Salat_0644500 [Sesamum alatum]|uniref:Uncharacterized protein n=1 Tax=Sesamum alatum TaxID=300844 RepID=A0AAE1YRA7_9LAMI|nr:hypothetical protein Salat_0644500 [Sesamum alatum]
MAEQKINELQEGLDCARAAEKGALEAKAAADARVAALEAQLSSTNALLKFNIFMDLSQGLIRTDLIPLLMVNFILILRMASLMPVVKMSSRPWSLKLVIFHSELK